MPSERTLAAQVNKIRRLSIEVYGESGFVSLTLRVVGYRERSKRLDPTEKTYRLYFDPPDASLESDRFSCFESNEWKDVLYLIEWLRIGINNKT